MAKGRIPIASSFSISHCSRSHVCPDGEIFCNVLVYVAEITGPHLKTVLSMAVFLDSYSKRVGENSLTSRGSICICSHSHAITYKLVDPRMDGTRLSRGTVTPERRDMLARFSPFVPGNRAQGQ